MAPEDHQHAWAPGAKDGKGRGSSSFSGTQSREGCGSGPKRAPGAWIPRPRFTRGRPQETEPQCLRVLGPCTSQAERILSQQYRSETARPQLWPLKVPSHLLLPPASWPTEATQDPESSSPPARTHRLGSSNGGWAGGVAALGVRGPGTLSPPRAR